MKLFKILHIINVPWFNAVAWYGLNTAFAQSQSGHEIHLAGDPDSPALTKAAESNFPRIVKLSFSRPNPVQQLLTAFALKDYLEKSQIDIVNAHQGNGFYGIALAVKLAKNKPLLIRTRGDIRYPRNNLFNRLLYTRISNGVIATSHIIHSRMTANFPIPETNITTIVPAVDENLFKQGSLDASSLKKKLGLSEKSALFGLIGRIDKKKGHRVAFQALKQVLNSGRDVYLVVAGPEADMTYSDLRSLASEIGVLDRILLLGRVADVREVMTACDAGIIPSTESEAICRVGLEFMALSVPILASNLNGIPDIVEHEVSGYLFKTGDSHDLAKTMSEFLNKPETHSRLKQQARKRVETQHTLSILSQTSVDFYRERLTIRN